MSIGVKAVFGTAGFNPGMYFGDSTAIKAVFDTLKKNGVDELDTARLYGQSEALIGQTPGHKDFTISTKWATGFLSNLASKDTIIADAKDSFQKVDIEQFDIFYLHAPDSSVSFEETLEGVNEAYKAGIFKRFGLSNFSAEQVEEVYNITKSKGWVVPTVYQGNYSAVARKIETLLFPTLRKLGMSFYAYSPIAGGFLVKTKEQILEGKGRWSDKAVGGLYQKLYGRPAYLEALSEWNAVAEKEGVSKAELAYRWIGYHSQIKKELGDAVIFGSSSLKQIDETTASLQRGPLSDEAVQRIEQIWKSLEHEAPIDNFQVASESNVNVKD